MANSADPDQLASSDPAKIQISLYIFTQSDQNLSCRFEEVLDSISRVLMEDHIFLISPQTIVIGTH